jgi:pyruvate dehydrogenase E2 component (dihydrolipoamide acetyltransferase)
MTISFKLPDIGEGVAEAEIVGWSVSVGDHVDELQTVLEVMTDKAVADIPAPSAGTITEIRAVEGETVKVGDVIFVLDDDGGGGEATVVEAPAETAAPEPIAAPVAPARQDKVIAVPSARSKARELGVDLASVTGTGRNGVIRRSDVESFAESGASAGAIPSPSGATPISIPPGEGQQRAPFRGIRRKIADAMTRSKYTATHFTVVEELDVTELVALRKQAKEIGAREGVNVTYMPFIMKATAIALARYPELNSQLDEVAQEVVTFEHVNLGIAMDTDNGLIVPVIPDIQDKSPMRLAHDLQELAERTRSGKVTATDLKGGTFSITNAGNIGGILATPIINFPEVAILGVHRIVKRPGVVETPEGDLIEVRHYMNLSISVDHRLADGASGARFLVAMKELLESPALLALHS